MASLKLTPSEENLKNHEKEDSCMVLNKVMSKVEQTYEQFMEGFVFLKPGDLTKKNLAGPTDSLEGKYSSHSVVTTTGQTRTSLTTTSTPSVLVQGATQIPVQQEEIDEETLVEGSTSSRMRASAVVRTGAHVQFDNFVEEDDVDEDLDTDYTMTGYAASFTQDAQASHHYCPSKASDDKARGNSTSADTPAARKNPSSTDQHDMLLSTLSTSDSVTDKLRGGFQK